MLKMYFFGVVGIHDLRSLFVRVALPGDCAILFFDLLDGGILWQIKQRVEIGCTSETKFSYCR